MGKPFTALQNLLELNGIEYTPTVPLSEHTTFRIGGSCTLAVFPSTEEQLIFTMRQIHTMHLPNFVMGNGSDVLASDSGFDGVVVFTKGVHAVSVTTTDEEYSRITASCGVSLTALSRTAQSNSLGGLSFACGIPGSVGGAILMNAGAFGGEMGTIAESVRFYDTEKDSIMTFDRASCEFSYRHSIFHEKDGVILSASFLLPRQDPRTVLSEMEDCMERRRTKQPLEYPSAGSTFKRYPGLITAQLIDEAGLKGLSCGGAQISEKHAGFIVNRGGATAEDVCQLIHVIKDKIRERNGIDIECEIVMLGMEENRL